MKRKSPVAEALKETKVEKTFRSEVERHVAEQLSAANVKFAFEDKFMPYVVPQRTARYLPDFIIPGTNIIIEAKGHFGGLKCVGDMKRRSAENRQKMVLLKEQYPELDFRIVFDKRSHNTKLYKGSPTSQGKWATDHGFKWASNGTIPPAWLADILMQQKKGKTR